MNYWWNNEYRGIKMSITKKNGIQRTFLRMIAIIRMKAMKKVLNTLRLCL